ncbi:uncharacterized protein LOC6542452 [Drosophila erecta]|uniref:Uncharacterized protein n=1 Tax=Drosophila erecta TaxID=7220 RepID=A0A0Q5WCC1_DROER|nr:uncharacterized protein LOC6542452 [Drosophila erecta]KQS71027.1 uncharacterized protein Dere_GG10822 [Drosophila erecta]
MSSGALNTLAIVLLLVPGTFCQCVNCNAHWKFHCKTNLTGYYCAPGAYIHQWIMTEEEYQLGFTGFTTPFSSCTPFPLELSYVETFCCLYSPKYGCQLALNPGIFKKEKLPASRCEDCIKHCRCSNKATAPLKPRMMVPLLGVLAMLTEWIYSARKVWAGCGASYLSIGSS